MFKKFRNWIDKKINDSENKINKVIQNNVQGLEMKSNDLKKEIEDLKLIRAEVVSKITEDKVITDYNIGKVLKKITDSEEIDKERKLEIGKFKNELEKRLMDFHKEITNKCFSSMENIMRYTKEVSLIDRLASQMKDNDLVALQASLLQPVLQTRIQAEKNKRAEKITESFVKNGNDIISGRNKIHKEFLDMQKKGQDILAIKEKLDSYDEIISKLEKE